MEVFRFCSAVFQISGTEHLDQKGYNLPSNLKHYGNSISLLHIYNDEQMINYFEFYELPESFVLDEGLLKKKFYALSKQYHPDFYANEDEAKQQEILEISTINNKAYQTLSDHARRLEYILKQHDLVNEGAKPQLPADFLMEMMDLNERLMEADDAGQIANIRAEVLALEDELNTELKALTTDYETLNDTAKESRLNGIADIYYRQKYLLRIKESLNTFASRF
jgi:molecular chaperone HscB